MKPETIQTTLADLRSWSRGDSGRRGDVMRAAERVIVELVAAHAAPASAEPDVTCSYGPEGCERSACRAWCGGQA